VRRKVEQVTFDLPVTTLKQVMRVATERDAEVGDMLADLVADGLRVVANRTRGAEALNARLTPEQRAANARKGGLAKAARAAATTTGDPHA
jgi:hypothetical protein